MEDRKPSEPAIKKPGRGRPRKKIGAGSETAIVPPSDLVLHEDDHAQLVMPLPVKKGLSSLNLARYFMMYAYKSLKKRRLAPPPQVRKSSWIQRILS